MGSRCYEQGPSRVAGDERAGVRWWALIVAAGGALAAGLLIGLIFHGFPDRLDVDAALARAEAADSRQQRAEVLTHLMRSLRDPQSTEDDEIVQHALRGLRRLHDRHADGTVLVALDRTKLDGGFWNTICSFYRELLAKKAAPAEPQPGWGYARCD